MLQSASVELKYLRRGAFPWTRESSVDDQGDSSRSDCHERKGCTRERDVCSAQKWLWRSWPPFVQLRWSLLLVLLVTKVGLRLFAAGWSFDGCELVLHSVSFTAHCFKIVPGWIQNTFWWVFWGRSLLLGWRPSLLGSRLEAIALRLAAWSATSATIAARGPGTSLFMSKKPVVTLAHRHALPKEPVSKN